MKIKIHTCEFVCWNLNFSLLVVPLHTRHQLDYQQQQCLRLHVSWQPALCVVQSCATSHVFQLISSTSTQQANMSFSNQNLPPFQLFHFSYITFKNRDSSVSIVTELSWLDNQGSMVWFPVGTGNLSLHHCVQNSSGAHPAPYPMGTRGRVAGVWSWPLTSI
jgi:hypothetical protein